MGFYTGHCQQIDTIDYSIPRELFVPVALPEIDALMKTLGESFKSEAAYQIEQFTYVEKWKWLKYLPTFGYDFSMNRPIVAYNSNALFGVINSGRKKEANLNSIIHKINLDYEREAISLSLNYDIFGTQNAVYHNRMQVLRLEKMNMDLSYNQYKEHHLEPSQYLNKLISFKNKVLQLSELKTDIVKLRSELLEMAFYGERRILLNSVEDVTTNRN
ncbi:MAG: hypothetical protein OCD76_19490 [Reichenbachiella sp.]